MSNLLVDITVIGDKIKINKKDKTLNKDLKQEIRQK